MLDELMRGLPSRLRVQLEYPRGSFVKRDSDGSIDFVSPFPSPYNYGFAPGVAGGDGDPLDVVVLGEFPSWRRNDEIEVPVRGIVGFIDRGLPDHKVVCAERPPTRAQRVGLATFFIVYASFKRGLARARGHRDITAYLGLYLRPPTV